MVNTILEENKLATASNFSEETWDYCLEEENTSQANVSYQNQDEDIDIPEDPYEVRTQRTFVNNPYNKAVVSLAMVGTGVFVLIQCLRFLTGGYFAEESKTDTVSEATEAESKIPEPQNTTVPQDDSLTMHQALNEQSQEIDRVREINLANEEPVDTSSSVQTSTVKSQTVEQPPAPKPIRRASVSPPIQEIRYEETKAQDADIAEEKETPVDPMEQWLMAANAGFYGSTNMSSTDIQPAADYGINNSPPPPQPQVVAVDYRQEVPEPLKPVSEEREEMEEQRDNSTLPQLSRGSVVEGELELPIIWMEGAEQYSRNREYSVEITSSLTDKNGTEIIPEGATAVVKAREFYGDTGFIELEVVSLSFEREGVEREYTIPENSLVVLDKKGEIIEAKAERTENLEGEAAAFVLSGISRAASVANNPTSTSYGYYGRSSRYEDRDLVSGFIEGVADSAVDGIQQRRNNARSASRQTPNVYKVKTGTDLQILVNKPFYLK